MFRQPYVPTRPHENFHYRTYPANPAGLYSEIHPESIKAQIDLYRWVRSLDFVNFVAIADLHKWLEADYSKRSMGQVVVSSTPYDPRRLKGVTKQNDKVISCYFWRDRQDLEYGLEWQICEWLHQVAATEDPEVIADELDELSSCSEDDLKSLYLDPIFNGDVTLERTDWMKIFKENGLPKDWTARDKSQKTGRKRLISRQDL